MSSSGVLMRLPELCHFLARLPPEVLSCGCDLAFASHAWHQPEAARSAWAAPTWRRAPAAPWPASPEALRDAWQARRRAGPWAQERSAAEFSRLVLAARGLARQLALARRFGPMVETWLGLSRVEPWGVRWEHFAAEGQVPEVEWLRKEAEGWIAAADEELGELQES